jgi:UDP:flavonoid glycosyltransferase YjiC (YdhE family)
LAGEPRRSFPPLRVLFVPVSGPAGAGEYYESLAVAAGIRARWPDARIGFVLSRQARYVASVPFPAVLVDTSPTHATAEVIRTIERDRPDVVIFASGGRVAQFAAARRLGARVVCMSPRPTARWRSFRLRRMRQMDQHWISEPAFAGARLTRWERLKLALAPRLEVVFFDGLHEPIVEESVAERRRELGLEGRTYVVFCPGGGGVFAGVSAVPAFLAAARETAAQTNHAVILVSGPNSELSETGGERLRIVGSLPNGDLMGLIRDARLAVTTGGTLMLQSLMQGTPCVAAPVAGDQPGRIRMCARRDLVQPAQLTAASLQAAALELLGDPARLDAVRLAIAHSHVRNGATLAVAALARLLGRERETDPAGHQ